MPGFFNQGLLARASSIGARIMRNTFKELSEHHSNFGGSPVSVSEMIRTAYSTTDQEKLPLLVKMTVEQEAKHEVIEYRARVAHGLRVGAQREAWKIMMETDPIEGPEDVKSLKVRNMGLYGTEQPTFDWLVTKYKAKGLSAKDATKEILNSAKRTNRQYDEHMKVSLEKLGAIPLPANSEEQRSKLSI